MFGKNPNFRTKLQIAVKVQLVGATAFPAFVFLRPDERLTDLLNDNRSFIPIKHVNGLTDIVSKTAIASIIECLADDDDETAENPTAGDVIHLGADDTAFDDLEPDAGMSAEQSDRRQNADGASHSAGAKSDRANYGENAEKSKSHDRDQSGENDRSSDGRGAGENGAGDNRADPGRRRRKRLLPYEILRVSPDATLEAVRQAYKSRIKAVHPDRLGGLALDDEFSRAALIASQRVNRAYQAILKERERASAADTSSTTEDDDAPDKNSATG